MTQAEFLVEIAQLLKNAQIPFMLTGSHSSSHYGQPRGTNDVDFVIDPTVDQLEKLLTLIGEKYYVSREAALEALQRRFMFNVINFDEGWKADFIIRKNRPFDIEEFQRRRLEALYGHQVPVASPEGVILSKLEWDKITPSERQLKDALEVALVQGPKLDRDYLRRWAPELGVADKLESLLRQADQLEASQAKEG